MAILTGNPSWDSVYQVATSDAVIGGPGGILNLAAQALLNRTTMLQSASGAGYVGYTPLGAGASPTNVQASLQRYFIDGDAFVNPSNTAVQNNTGWTALTTYAATFPGGTHVMLSAGTILFSAPTPIIPGMHLTGAGKTATIFSYSHTGNGITSTSAINSSTIFAASVEHIELLCTNASNFGAAYVDVGGTFINLFSVKYSGWQTCVIFDQTTLANIDLCDFEVPAYGTQGLWLANATYTSGTNAGYTNGISVSRNQFNGNSNACGVRDDGGMQHSFTGNNLNNLGYYGMVLAGVNGLLVQGNKFSLNINADISLTYSNSIGGYVGPCSAFDVKGNVFLSTGISIVVVDAVDGSITSNLFCGLQGMSFSSPTTNRSTGIIFEGNSKPLQSSATPSAGVFFGIPTANVAAIFRRNMIRQAAATYSSSSATSGSVVITPYAMEFIRVGSRLSLVNQAGTNPETVVVTAVTSTTFTATLASSKLANFIIYGATPQDQEAGTFTPTLSGSSVSGTNTYTAQNGRYERRGNLVTAWGQIVTSAIDPTMAGNVYIPLPFAAANDATNIACGAITYSGVTLTAGYTQVGSTLAAGSLQLQLAMSGSGQAMANVTPSMLAAATTIYFQVTYSTNAA